MVFRKPFYRILLSFLLFFLIISGCKAQRIVKLETLDLALEGSGHSVVIKTEIARTSEEKSRGLMFRTELADGEGMLFVFERDDFLSFWMKDTLIPLSIAFILTDGRITEIRDMEPGNLNPVRSNRSVRYALEVPQGWFSRVNIVVGDRLILDGL